MDFFFSFVGSPCDAGDKTLVANVFGGVPPYGYQWSTGGTGQEVVLPSGFAGPVTVSITDNSGCMLVSTIEIAPNLEVLALTKKESAPGAADGTIDLLVLSGQAPFHFQWSNGSTTEDLSGLSSGTYTVTVTGADACTFILTIPLITTVGTSETNLDQRVEISPNPATDLLQVRFYEKPTQPVQLQLMDLTGRTLLTKSCTEASCSLEIAQLPEGIFMLWIETPSGPSGHQVMIGR